MERWQGSRMRAALKRLRNFVNDNQGYILLAILVILILK
tara:strand:+ start:274 stop:390 length:117 start_codon:yes stop_codon:yes gene_type:complete